MASHGTDQLMVQRLLVAKNLRESRLSLLSSGVVVFIQFTLFLLIGAGLYVHYAQSGTLPHVQSADRIFPAFIVQEMPVGISGLMLAAVLAAAMSNLSAALNSLSSTSVIDFYLPRHPEASEARKTRLSRIMTVAWAIVLFGLAMLSRRGGHVLEIGLSIASVLWGAMLGVFLLGTLTKRAGEKGTIAGMIAGCVVNILLWVQTRPFTFALFGSSLTMPKIAWTWYVTIGSIVTCVVGYTASLLFDKQSTAT
jgi:Na+/proline symporter